MILFTETKEDKEYLEKKLMGLFGEVDVTITDSDLKLFPKCGETIDDKNVITPKLEMRLKKASRDELLLIETFIEVVKYNLQDNNLYVSIVEPLKIELAEHEEKEISAILIESYGDLISLVSIVRYVSNGVSNALH